MCVCFRVVVWTSTTQRKGEQASAFCFLFLKPREAKSHFVLPSFLSLFLIRFISLPFFVPLFPPPFLKRREAAGLDRFQSLRCIHTFLFPFPSLVLHSSLSFPLFFCVSVLCEWCPFVSTENGSKRLPTPFSTPSSSSSWKSNCFSSSFARYTICSLQHAIVRFNTFPTTVADLKGLLSPPHPPIGR